METALEDSHPSFEQATRISNEDIEEEHDEVEDRHQDVLEDEVQQSPSRKFSTDEPVLKSSPTVETTLEDSHSSFEHATGVSNEDIDEEHREGDDQSSLKQSLTSEDMNDESTRLEENDDHEHVPTTGLPAHEEQRYSPERKPSTDEPVLKSSPTVETTLEDSHSSFEHATGISNEDVEEEHREDDDQSSLKQSLTSEEITHESIRLSEHDDEEENRDHPDTSIESQQDEPVLQSSPTVKTPLEDSHSSFEHSASASHDEIDDPSSLKHSLTGEEMAEKKDEETQPERKLSTEFITATTPRRVELEDNAQDHLEPVIAAQPEKKQDEPEELPADRSWTSKFMDQMKSYMPGSTLSPPKADDQQQSTVHDESQFDREERLESAHSLASHHDEQQTSADQSSSLSVDRSDEKSTLDQDEETAYTEEESDKDLEAERVKSVQSFITEYQPQADEVRSPTKFEPVTFVVASAASSEVDDEHTGSEGEAQDDEERYKETHVLPLVASAATQDDAPTPTRDNNQLVLESFQVDKQYSPEREHSDDQMVLASSGRSDISHDEIKAPSRHSSVRDDVERRPSSEDIKERLSELEPESEEQRLVSAGQVSLDFSVQGAEETLQSTQSLDQTEHDEPLKRPQEWTQSSLQRDELYGNQYRPETYALESPEIEIQLSPDYNTQAELKSPIIPHVQHASIISRTIGSHSPQSEPEEQDVDEFRPTHLDISVPDDKDLSKVSTPETEIVMSPLDETAQYEEALVQTSNDMANRILTDAFKETTEQEHDLLLHQTATDIVQDVMEQIYTKQDDELVVSQREEATSADVSIGELTDWSLLVKTQDEEKPATSKSSDDDEDDDDDDVQSAPMSSHTAQDFKELLTELSNLDTHDDKENEKVAETIDQPFLSASDVLRSKSTEEISDLAEELQRLDQQINDNTNLIRSSSPSSTSSTSDNDEIHHYDVHSPPATSGTELQTILEQSEEPMNVSTNTTEDVSRPGDIEELTRDIIRQRHDSLSGATEANVHRTERRPSSPPTSPLLKKEFVEITCSSMNDVDEVQDQLLHEYEENEGLEDMIHTAIQQAQDNLLPDVSAPQVWMTSVV